MKLTYFQAVARLKAIEGELADKERPSRSANLRAATLAVEADEVNEHRKRLERTQELARGNGGRNIRSARHPRCRAV